VRTDQNPSRLRSAVPEVYQPVFEALGARNRYNNDYAVFICLSPAYSDPFERTVWICVSPVDNLVGFFRADCGQLYQWPNGGRSGRS
jgi:hypothetical protein